MKKLLVVLIMGMFFLAGCNSTVPKSKVLNDNPDLKSEIESLQQKIANGEITPEQAKQTLLEEQKKNEVGAKEPSTEEILQKIGEVAPGSADFLRAKINERQKKVTETKE